MNNTQLLWVIARLLYIVASVLTVDRETVRYDKDLEYIHTILGKELP